MRDRVKGTVQRRKRLNPRDLLEIVAPLPPLAEQRRIVDFLDRVEGGLSLAGAYRDAYQAIRTALVDRLYSFVSAPCLTLGEIAEFDNGYPFKPSDFTPDGLPVIRIRQLLDPLEPCDRSSASVGARFHLSDGDLVFSWSGTLAVRYWDRGPAWLNQHLFKVTERPGFDRRWLQYALEFAVPHLENMTHGTTMKHITKRELLRFSVHAPDVEEQRTIADVLIATDEVGKASERVRTALGRLRSTVLASLLSGDHEIPGSYDALLKEAAVA